MVFFIPKHCLYLLGSAGKDIDENLVWKFPVYHQFLIILCSYVRCVLSNLSVVPHSFSHIGDEKTQLPIFSILGIYCWRIYNLKSWSSVHLINQCKSHKYPYVLSLVHLQLSFICISDQHTVYYKMKVFELTQMQWLHNNYLCPLRHMWNDRYLLLEIIKLKSVDDTYRLSNINMKFSTLWSLSCNDGYTCSQRKLNVTRTLLVCNIFTITRLFIIGIRSHPWLVMAHLFLMKILTMIFQIEGTRGKFLSLIP